MCASTELKVHVLLVCNWSKGFYGSVVRKCIHWPFTSQDWTLVLLLVSPQTKKLKLTHPETQQRKRIICSCCRGGNDWSPNRVRITCILTLWSCVNLWWRKHSQVRQKEPSSTLTLWADRCRLSGLRWYFWEAPAWASPVWHCDLGRTSSGLHHQLWAVSPGVLDSGRYLL